MSTESKHTPGPVAWQNFGQWCLTAQYGMRKIVLSATKDPKTKLPVLATNVDGIMRPLTPDHPDAKVIAAAWDMLEALEAFVEKCLHIDGYDVLATELYNAAQAIKLAKGL